MNNNRIYEHVKEDIHELIYKARRNPISKEKIYFRYGKFVLNVTPQRAIYHAYLEEVFRKNNIEITKDLVCWENYSKEQADVFPKRVLKHLLTLEDWISKELVVLAEIVSKVVEGFGLLTIIGDKIVSLDNSASQLVEAYLNSETFREMLDTPAILPTDIPEVIVEKQNKLIRTMTKELEFEPFKTLMGSGVGINANQMKTMVVWGLVPLATDISEMHDIPVCSGRLNGFTSKADKLADDAAARRAIILTKINTKDTGALSKKINVLVQGIKLNEADSRAVTHDCGSKHTVPIYVANDKILKALEGKYRLENHTLIPISKNDKFLIENTVYIRSLTTCACQSTVCEVCWGVTAWANQDTNYIKYNAGTVGLKKTQAEIFQLVLSAKHHSFGNLGLMLLTLATYNNSVPVVKNITMREVPEDVFIRKYNIIECNPKYKYVLKGDSIINESTNKKAGKDVGTEDLLNDMLTNVKTKPIRVTTLLVYEKDESNPEQLGDLKYKLVYNHGFRLSRKDDGSYNAISIAGDILVDDDQTIKYVIPNIAVTEPYEKMKLLISGKLIDNASNGNVNVIGEYLVKGLDSIPKTHILDIETIVAALIRDPKNPRFKPNWRNVDEPQSTIISVNQANSIKSNTSLSRILQLGDVDRKIFSPLSEFTLPDEYDVIFNCLQPRVTNKNKSLFRSMDEIIAKNEG